jgi:hypothetical protein
MQLFGQMNMTQRHSIVCNVHDWSFEFEFLKKEFGKMHKLLAHFYFGKSQPEQTKY